MGTLYSRVLQQPLDGLAGIIGSRKRKRVESPDESRSDNGEDGDDGENRLLSTPKKWVVILW